MRTAMMIALASFALSFPIGCKGLGGQQTEGVWVSQDGSPVSPDVAERAEGECDRAATAEMTDRTRRPMSIDWAAAKRQCMANKGLVLTTQPVR
ncbi:MAG: hypothetical protein OEM05_01830 [Myxococcales bacterium]|nr:hypothetical protein [Myxococcales bacterium]